MENTKKCTKCKIEKEITEFSPNLSAKDGRHTQCKSCKNEYKLANKEKYKEYQRKYNREHRKKNRENRKEYFKEYYKKNKEKKIEYRNKNKEKQSEYDKEYYQDNKDKRKDYSKKHYQENKEHYAEYQKEYRKGRYHSNPDYKLSRLVGQFCRRVTDAVKENKELRSLEYLGCSLAEFKAHIESQWQEGMTWENHSLHGWHIDHIKPIDWFVKNSDDPWQANHYLNLQPLWAEENFSKGNK